MIFRLIISAALLSSGIAVAQQHNSTYGSGESCSDVSYGFEFRSLILKPSSGNLYYAAEAVPIPVPSPYWNIVSICPDFHYGFELAGSAYIPSRKAKLTLSWEHFSSSDADARNVGSTNMVGPFFEIGPDALPYKEVAGLAQYNYDSISLTYGHFFCTEEYLQTTCFGGINITRLKETLFSRFSNLDQTVVRTITVPLQFTGAGPQAGVDAQCRLINSLFLTGKVSAALVAGKQKNSTFFTAETPALADLDIPSPNRQKVCVPALDVVIPWFYQRIGAAYAFSFSACDVVLEVGYESRVYINALQSINLNSEVNTPPVTPDTVGVFARTFTRSMSNFSLGGPYVTLAFDF